MCLRSKFTKKLKKEFLDTIHREGLTVYKIVGIGVSNYFPPCKRTKEPYAEGIVEADTSISIEMYNSSKYKAGFHFYVSLEDAKWGLSLVRGSIKNSLQVNIKDAKARGEKIRNNYTVIECVAKKSWITAVGKDTMAGHSNCTVLVAKKAIFPKFSRKNKKC